MAVTPTTPANGEAKGAPAEMTDDLRYARDRTGWAPRFEIQKPEGEEEATLLDHQDFLESKLDDKFFGGRRRPLPLVWINDADAGLSQTGTIMLR